MGKLFFWVCIEDKKKLLEYMDKNQNAEDL